MSNMSYCKFTNTRSDVADCLDTIRRGEKLSASEATAGLGMFRELLTFLRDYEIIEDFDFEVAEELFEGLRLGGSV